ncbi:MAG TPA: hypothetical protein PKY59_01210 [Pyrinomonadaceae bacterium]|nr:hypothetical protein [Pyrinomonadaceae bacterium]
MSKDYLPNTWSALADWSQNFYTELNNSLAAKYGVTDKMVQLEKDNLWLQYWAGAKLSVKNQMEQLTDYTDGIAGGALGSPALTMPAWALPDNLPNNVPPGIKARIREIAATIKAQKSIYTTADGELLGIIPPDEANRDPNDFTPDVKLRSLPNFALEAVCRLFGLDALRLEYRHKGGDWQYAATLTSNPGVFNIHPQVAGQAEQIEIRAVYIEKNEIYGNYSPSYAVVIQP